MVKKHRNFQGRRPRDVAKRADGAGADDNDGWRADPRFGHLATDPRYRSASARKAARVEIDSRFQAMFSDPDFTTDARSDKRGRPVAMSSRQDLRRFYGLKSGDGAEAQPDDGEDEESEQSGVDEDEAEKSSDDQKEVEEEEDDDDDDDQDDEEEDDEAQQKAESSSEDEEFRSLERSAAAAAAASDAEAAPSVEPTSRLAVTQQDWDQLKATDLYMLLSCRCQAVQGRLLSVTVYPSQFGQRRMAAEAASGPVELAAITSKKSSSTGSVAPVTEDAAYRRSLRRHQMKRLWYYYAVAEFDSAETAASVYEQCAGLEIEATGGCLRLSYVPNGMQFGGPDDVPDDWRHLITRCTGIDPAAYKPSKFATTSLGRTQVGITWDETPAERTRYLQGLFAKGEFDETDPDLKRLADFLAMSSDEDGEEGGVEGAEAGRAKAAAAAAAAARRRALLLGDPAAFAESAAAAATHGVEEVAAFSDDELPDDAVEAAFAAPPPAAAAESRKRTRRRRLKEQAKRAKLAKAGLLPSASAAAAAGGSSDDDEGAATEMPATEQELAMLVADRSGASGRGRVTATDVASDARFGALFTDPSYHLDPTHSEAAKAAEVQRLIVGAKKRAAMDS